VISSEALFADRYRLEALIGEGKRKKVYRAVDTRLDRDVALALLDDSEPERARREVEVEARLTAVFTDHPYIVTVFDAAWQRDQPYLVFELMEGGDLEAYCQRHCSEGVSIPLADALRWTNQICQALAFVHERGLVHCDVAPGNIWLDAKARAHLGDFDSAVACDDGGPPARQADDTTTEYQAPELARGDPPEPRSDLYSLGATLHYILAGAPPLGPTLAEGRVPADVADLLGRLLKTEPAERPESAVVVHGIIETLTAPPKRHDLEALLAQGEGAHVEFKGSMLQPLEPDPPTPEANQRKAVQKAITKSVAAFLNTGGGSLIIGVGDTGEPVGIEVDFELLAESQRTRDGWELRLKDLLANSLGPDAMKGVAIRYEVSGAKTIAIVDVERRPRETWLRDGQIEEFYVRVANASQQLTGSSLIAYIREAWPRLGPS
jgi:serine/threonine protein kinase